MLATSLARCSNFHFLSMAGVSRAVSRVAHMELRLRGCRDTCATYAVVCKPRRRVETILGSRACAWRRLRRITSTRHLVVSSVRSYLDMDLVILFSDIAITADKGCPRLTSDIAHRNYYAGIRQPPRYLPDQASASVYRPHQHRKCSPPRLPLRKFFRRNTGPRGAVCVGR